MEMRVEVRRSGVLHADLRVCDLELCHRQRLHLLQTVHHLQKPLVKEKSDGGERGSCRGVWGGGGGERLTS